MLLEAMKGVGSAVVIIIGVALWVVPDPIAKALKLGVSGEEIWQQRIRSVPNE